MCCIQEVKWREHKVRFLGETNCGCPKMTRRMDGARIRYKRVLKVQKNDIYVFMTIVLMFKKEPVRVICAKIRRVEAQ